MDLGVISSLPATGEMEKGGFFFHPRSTDDRESETRIGVFLSFRQGREGPSILSCCVNKEERRNILLCLVEKGEGKQMHAYCIFSCGPERRVTMLWQSEEEYRGRGREKKKPHRLSPEGEKKGVRMGRFLLAGTQRKDNSCCGDHRGGPVRTPGGGKKNYKNIDLVSSRRI